MPNGTVSHCIPVLGCTDTGLSLLGRAYGRRAGRIEAQFSDGNFCAGNWQDGTVDFICADGDTATLPIRYTDPLTGSAEIIGRTAMGRKIRAASGLHAKAALDLGGLPMIGGKSCDAG